MSASGSFDRAEALRRLGDEQFDVLVVGGGITGAGVVLDAASRGLRAALVERADFAAGTSSKSSKMVHGGLRYLQNGEVRLVYEALAERQRLRKNAPHLVKVLPFLIPLFSKGGIIPRRISFALGWAMWLYDLTGGARIGKLHKKLKTAEALEYMPTLPAEHIGGAYLYYDARADDARLTLAIARTAALDHGAVVANRCRLVGVRKDAAGKVASATVDAGDGRIVEVACSTIVNATGVWADQVRAIDEGTDPDSIRPAKGIHITVPWSKVRNTIAAVVPVPKDKRSVFVVRWGDLTYVGTTDTDYDGDLDEPQCTAEDVAYLLRAINAAVTTTITTDDVLGTWAGLRPLVKDAETERTADLSRRHKVQASPSGVVTITGGKLTTYRNMASDTVDKVLDVLGDRRPKGVKRGSRTKKLRLVGAAGYEQARQADEHLADRYGGETEAVLALVERDRSLHEPLVPGLPYLKAEAVHAVRAEMATTLDDVLARRTRARLLARDATAAAAEDVAALIGDELGWDADERRRQVESYRASVAAERAAADLPETALERTLGS